MTSKFLLAPVAVAAALCFGAVSAQTTTTAPATGAGTTSSGSMAAGGAAPRTQTGPAASDKMADKAAKKDDKLARGDRKFIEDALNHGKFEIQAGQLAATKATDPAIKSYGEQMVKDHTEAVRLFEQQAEREADPEVKAFAQKTLPTLREHLEMARQIQQQLGRSGQ